MTKRSIGNRSGIVDRSHFESQLRVGNQCPKQAMYFGCEEIDTPLTICWIH